MLIGVGSRAEGLGQTRTSVPRIPTGLSAPEDLVQLLAGTPAAPRFAAARAHVRAAHAALAPVFAALLGAYAAHLRAEWFGLGAWLWAAELWYAYSIQVGACGRHTHIPLPVCVPSGGDTDRRIAGEGWVRQPACYTASSVPAAAMSGLALARPPRATPPRHPWHANPPLPLPPGPGGRRCNSLTARCALPWRLT